MFNKNVATYIVLPTLNESMYVVSIIENIICFDVSHLSGSSTVGSCVWFTREGPQKNLYRRYNVIDVKKSDDYGAMKFILYKYYIQFCFIF